MTDLSSVRGISIPEGALVRIESGGETLWKAKAAQYTVTYELSECTTDNDASAVEAESGYTAAITGVESQGFYFRSTSDYCVTMGGVDITSDAVSHGAFPTLTLSVNIPSVTGDIYIKATAC